MARSLLALTGVAVVGWAVACGSPPPTTAPTLPVAPPPSASVVAAPEPTPDVSPVPAPDGLALTLHLAHPRTTLDIVAGLLGSTASSLVGSALDVEHLVNLAAGAPIGALVDPEQPIDFAASDLDADEASPKVVGSAVLANPAAARETLERFYSLVPTAPGVVRLKPKDDAPDGAKPLPCMTAPGAGGTTRLVCGLDEEAVRHLGPYLVRTLPRVSSRADLRLEAFVKAFHLPGSGPDATPTAGDGGAKDPVDQLVDRLGDQSGKDVQSVVLEASTDGAALDVALTTSFGSAASPLTRALVGLGAPGTIPPPAYGRLPKDAAFAWFSRGASAADLAPLREALFGSLRDWFLDDGYSQAQIDDELTPVRTIALTGGPWVVATGYRYDEAQKALSAYVAGKPSLAARTKARLAMQGWAVAGIDDASQTWVDAVRRMVAIDARKPAGKPRRKREPTEDKTSLTITPVPRGLTLPDGTLHVEARSVPNPEWIAARAKKKDPVKEPGIPYTTHLFVVPEGAHTWFGFGEDPALVARELALVLASPPGGPGPRTTALDGAVRSQAGFVTFTALAMWLAGDSTDEALHKAHEALTGLAGIPAAASAEMSMALVATPADGGVAAGGDVGVRVVVPVAPAAAVASAMPSIF